MRWKDSSVSINPRACCRSGIWSWRPARRGSWRSPSGRWRSKRGECSMYQRIIVPLDGSDLAQTALPHALELCRAIGATLVLLHVRDPRSGSVEAARRYLEYVRSQHARENVAIELVVREG